MTNQVGGTVAVEDGHLHVHEYNVGFWSRCRWREEEIVKSFPTIPDGRDREAKLTDGFDSDLLIDRATIVSINRQDALSQHSLILNHKHMDALSVQLGRVTRRDWRIAQRGILPTWDMIWRETGLIQRAHWWGPTDAPNV